MHFLGPVFLLLLQPAFSAFVAASDFHQLLSEKRAQPLPTASTLAQGSSEEKEVVMSLGSKLFVLFVHDVYL